LLTQAVFAALLLAQLLSFMPGKCAEAVNHYRPSDLLVHADETLAPPRTLSPAEVRDDVELLVYALKYGYGGRKFVTAATFVKALQDLSQLGRGSAEKPDGKNTSPEDLKDRIDEILWTIPDAHLRARLTGKSSTVRELASRKDDVGKNAISPEARVWDVRLDNKEGCKILYVSIVSFPSARDHIWRGFLDQVKSLMKGSQLLVIDLRANGGGDDSMGFELARLCYGNELNVSCCRQIIRQTPQALAIWANMYRLLEMGEKESGKTPPPYLHSKYKKIMDRYKLALSGKVKEEKLRVFRNKHVAFNPARGYDRPIYILIDGSCKSSGESTIDAFECHPAVKKVGRNTAGMIHFGNVGLLVLPHSKILVQIPTMYNEYADKRFIEKTGIKPDIETAPGQDAYDLALQDFKKTHARSSQ
jgi:hypothetical protein